MQADYKLGRNPFKKPKRTEKGLSTATATTPAAAAATTLPSAEDSVTNFAAKSLGFEKSILEKTSTPSALEKIREMQIQVHWPELLQTTLETRVGVQLTKLVRFFSRS